MRTTFIASLLLALGLAVGCGGGSEKDPPAEQSHAANATEMAPMDSKDTMPGMAAHDTQEHAPVDTAMSHLKHEPVVSIGEGEVITRYKCPMHPDYIRDEPGTCAICGMTLVPFTVNPNEKRSDVSGRAIVTMKGALQQRVGVRTEEVQELTVMKNIRTVGRVVPDERRVTRIHTKFSGWVEKLYADYTGQEVKRGDPVLDIYSPELVAAEQEYLIAYRTNRGKTQGANLLRVARERLKLLDMTDAQIDHLEQSGTPKTTLTIFAPYDGTIVEKFVDAGQRVSAATNLYTIADLSRVWVLADAYEADLPLIKVGQWGEVTMPSNPSGVLRGRVTFVSPVVDVTTRTAPFRMEFANTDGSLRPGAFLDVNLAIPLGKRLVTPRESILDSGTRQIAFVETEPGRFEPRDVRLGLRTDGLVEVLGGLTAGEKVVVSATFLIDSESQLRAAISGAMANMPGMAGMSDKKNDDKEN